MSAGGPILRDIHLPSAAWWPPAPGWWLLAGLMVMAVAAVAWLAWRRARLRPLRVALREIDLLQTAYAHDGDMASLAAGASRLLRRVALLGDPSVAASAGETWRAFLHRHAANEDEVRILDALMVALFRSHPEVDAKVLLSVLRAWCKRVLRGSHGFRFGERSHYPSGSTPSSRSRRSREGRGERGADAVPDAVSRWQGP